MEHVIKIRGSISLPGTYDILKVKKSWFFYVLDFENSLLTYIKFLLVEILCLKKISSEGYYFSVKKQPKYFLI